MVKIGLLYSEHTGETSWQGGKYPIIIVALLGIISKLRIWFQDQLYTIHRKIQTGRQEMSQAQLARYHLR